MLSSAYAQALTRKAPEERRPKQGLARVRAMLPPPPCGRVLAACEHVQVAISHRKLWHIILARTRLFSGVGLLGLFYDQPAACTASCVSEQVHGLRLDRRTFNAIVVDHNARRKASLDHGRRATAHLVPLSLRDRLRPWLLYAATAVAGADAALRAHQRRRD